MKPKTAHLLFSLVFCYFAFISNYFRKEETGHFATRVFFSKIENGNLFIADYSTLILDEMKILGDVYILIISYF